MNVRVGGALQELISSKVKRLRYLSRDFNRIPRIAAGQR